MPVRSLTPILNVRDVPSSMAWFEALGWKRSFAWNDGGVIPDAADRDEHGPAHFGGVCSGDATIFLCCNGQGSRGGPVPRHVTGNLTGNDTGDDTGGVWMSWWCSSPEEVDALFELARGLGYDTPHPPTDEPWGARECWLRHPDGHTFRVSAGTE